MAAASNVVLLPTAARRKPENHRYAAQREFCTSLRNQTASRFAYRHPSVRSADRDAEVFDRLELTPALLIAAAMFKHLPPEAQEQAMAEVGKRTSGNSKAEALLVMRINGPMPFAEQWNLMNAIDRRRGDFSRGGE